MNEKMASKWVWDNIQHVTAAATFGRKHKRQRVGLFGTLFLGALTLALAFMFY